MQRSLLVFATGFIALMAGALFYAARLPVQAPDAPSQSAPDAAAESAPVTQAAPVYVSFTLPDMDGQSRDFSEWGGKHTLLNFWATWCAPCRREIPLLKTFHDEQRANGIQVIGIAVDDALPVAQYARDMQFNYPVLVGQQDAMAVAESSGLEFIGMPFTMIVAADGELLNAHFGEIHDADLDHIAEVLQLLYAGEIDRDSARKALEFL